MPFIQTAALNFFGAHELLVLFGAGAFVALARSLLRRQPAPGGDSLPGFALPISFGATVTAGTTAAAATPFALGTLFLFFLKVGAVLFGSGYVLLAFLRADLVDRWHWLTSDQLLDAIAVGQVTPGPVFTTATFIGYLLSGTGGAVLATVGIFLPAFVFVALSSPFVPRLRRSVTAGDFLDGLNVASLALMAVVTWQLGHSALVDWPAVILAAVSFGLLLRTKINSAWLVLAGAMLGLLLKWILP